MQDGIPGRASKSVFAHEARSLLRLESRWLTVVLVFGMYACGTWHGPGGGGGCKLDGTDDDGGSSGSSGSSGATDAQAGSTSDSGPDTTPTDAGNTATTDAGVTGAIDSGMAVTSTPAP